LHGIYQYCGIAKQFRSRERYSAKFLAVDTSQFSDTASAAYVENIYTVYNRFLRSAHMVNAKETHNRGGWQATGGSTKHIIETTMKE